MEAKQYEQLLQKAWRADANGGDGIQLLAEESMLTLSQMAAHARGRRLVIDFEYILDAKQRQSEMAKAGQIIKIVG